MTVEQADTIDFMANEAPGDTVLAISDHLPWCEVNDHLYHLQEKLNAYLRFMESGEIYRKYPEVKGRALVIAVFLKFPVPETARWFFEQSSQAIKRAGFRLDVRQISN